MKPANVESEFETLLHADKKTERRLWWRELGILAMVLLLLWLRLRVFNY